MSGQEILDSKKKSKNFEWEDEIKKFHLWMKTQKNRDGKYYSDNATITAVHAVRSFFDYYRTPLILNNNDKRKLNGKPQRVTKDYMLTNTDIEKMAFVGNLREKYIILLGKSLGLRVSDFINLTYGDFRSINLDQEPPIAMGEIQTIKEKVTAYPFIDSDALPIIKQILESNPKKLSNERIIAVQDTELTSIIQRLAEKANINVGDKRLRFHCFRKYLIDRLKNHMSESAWKQIVGKAIAEEAYVGTLGLRECYQEVMKLTTINTNGNGKVSKIADQVSALSKIVTEKSQELEEQNKKIEKLEGQLKRIDSYYTNELLNMIKNSVINLMKGMSKEALISSLEDTLKKQGYEPLNDEQFKDKLIKKGIVTKEQWEKSLAENKKMLSEQ
jgi:integrase